MFPENVSQTIIIAPHTSYHIDYAVSEPDINPLRDLLSTPLLRQLESNDKVFFYQPLAVMEVNQSLKSRIDFAIQISVICRVILCHIYI